MKDGLRKILNGTTIGKHLIGSGIIDLWDDFKAWVKELWRKLMVMVTGRK